jgi:hypothetical protein
MKIFRYERKPEGSVNMKVCTVLRYKGQQKKFMRHGVAVQLTAL